ncbi:MAG: type II toxin-antitoxin system VapC family toxin [Deltaproteobacteria bacterium]|nr:type II toxin-antitoxin system VapC family toxin [Deltaproteobacteria bacterium]
MAPLLLDTHILLWWYLDHPSLPMTVAQRIEASEEHEGLAVSILSLWEIAKLVERGRFRPEFSLDEWFADLENDAGMWVIPLTARVILESTRLGPHFHRDPADQLIVATARCHNLHLATADERISRSGVVAIVT